jgi:hypothetical protein
MTPSRRELWTMVFAASAFAFLFSLSFVATPVKFLAPDVPIAHLLAVGRVTFQASLGVESVLIAALMLTVRGGVRWLIVATAAVLLVQWLILMPRLDERTLSRMAGIIREPSSLHHWWIVLDIARLGIYALILRKALLSARLTQLNDRLES